MHCLEEIIRRNKEAFVRETMNDTLTVIAVLTRLKEIHDGYTRQD